jgi:hypothetical protein
MMQFILAMAALFPIRLRTAHTGVGLRETAWPERSASPRERDAATRLADRALCGIDLPFIL